jgi:hypothetical protein
LRCVADEVVGEEIAPSIPVLGVEIPAVTAFNCLIDSLSMSAVSPFIAYLFVCYNAGDHR